MLLSAQLVDPGLSPASGGSSTLSNLTQHDHAEVQSAAGSILEATTALTYAGAPQSLRNRRLICGNIFAKHKEDTTERLTLR